MKSGVAGIREDRAAFAVCCGRGTAPDFLLCSPVNLLYSYSMSTAMALSAAEIRLIRERLEMTQQDFADRIHVTREAVAQWEGGHCRPGGPAEFLIRQLSAEADIAASKQAKVAP